MGFQSFQKEQQRIQLEKAHLHRELLQRLQDQEQQLHFEEQHLQKEQPFEVIELKEDVIRRITGANLDERKLAEVLSESTEENELKDTLAQVSAASCGAESQRVTDWEHNGTTARQLRRVTKFNWMPLMPILEHEFLYIRLPWIFRCRSILKR